VRALNRLELFGETMRSALNAIAVVAPDWLRGQAPTAWFERYSRRVEEYRLPKGKEQRLDEVWHADLTYIRVKQHFVYLACVLDGFSRKIVRHAISSFMESQLTLEALRKALQSRQPARGLIHHSDRGSQYANEKYTRVLEQHGVRISMSRVGRATDNAKIESFFGGLKRECINLEPFESLSDVLTNVPVSFPELFMNNIGARSREIDASTTHPTHFL
jgi:transposase InsO family protein